MQSVRAIFVFSTVLLVPFLYYATSIPDACAAPNDMFLLSSDCTGKETDRNGKTCCWVEEKKKVCQTCYTKTGTDGSYMQSCSPVKPAASQSTLPGLETQDRLPGGGVFEIPDNATLSQNISTSNDSSKTLAELQSDAEDETEEQSTEESDAEEEQDESAETEDETGEDE